MKKLLLSVAVAALCTATTAQQYIIVDDEIPVLATDVDKITYEQDDQFESRLLPDVLAADAKTKLFSEALQLTGLADTLRQYYYADYKAPDNRKYRYRSHTWNEMAWYNADRYKKFTVFAETDDVFAANGINDINQLKAYAKQVYDEAFPEDADISDPTDRRNSLNRFMAYHILGHGSPYWYLTYYDGVMTDKFVLTNLTDIATWYRTLMPEGSLKCSYPMAGDESGLYLNRRGLKDGPDKYGKQVRGAKIVASGNDNADPFTQQTFNGYYFYIDRLLAYDQTTRNDVLGSELWRVDLKTLSSDIMNNADELRGNYLVDGDTNHPDESPNPKNGRNFIYKWDCMENIKGDRVDFSYFIARRAHAVFWSWQGDEMNVLGDFGTISFKLPPLPEGEWEVRMGICALEIRPDVRISLNGEVTIDTLKLRRSYYGSELPLWEKPLRTEMLDYVENNILVPTKLEDGTYMITDVKSGETLYTGSRTNPYDYARKNSNNPLRDFRGHTNNEEYANWSERCEQAMKDYLATLPKVMKAPRECTLFSASGYQTCFSELTSYLVRYPLGRIHSDGRHDNYLQIENLGIDPSLHTNSELMLDYFEFVPKAVFDNPDIPEE